MGYIALIPGISFILIYTFNLREKGLESSEKDNKIWWNDIRPIHGMLYILFGIAAISRWKFCYSILLADVLVGLTVYLIHI